MLVPDAGPIVPPSGQDPPVCTVGVRECVGGLHYRGCLAAINDPCGGAPLPVRWSDPIACPADNYCSAGNCLLRKVRVLEMNTAFGGNEEYAAMAQAIINRRNAGLWWPDVIVLQEAFHDEGTTSNPYPELRSYFGTAGYPFFRHGPMRTGFLNYFGSGLVILSRIPIAGSTDRAFESGCAGWDCFARKGLMTVHLQMPACSTGLVVLNTHFQAHPDNWDVRVGQRTELVGHVNYHHAQAGMVFSGDFNYDQADTGYSVLLGSWPTIRNTQVYCAQNPGCVAAGPLNPVTSWWLEDVLVLDRPGPSLWTTPVRVGLHPGVPPNPYGVNSDHQTMEYDFVVGCQ
jgi:endonuclease/exonuclease/phosphatase family metal-dependent hydrolase